MSFHPRTYCVHGKCPVPNTLTNQASKPEGGSPWLSKTLVVAICPALLKQMFPPHSHHLAFGIGLLSGIIIQHFIPPRGTGRVLAFALALALALSLLNWYLF